MLVIRIIETPIGGWDVLGELDGQSIGAKHCDDWHRVERARRELQIRFALQILAERHQTIGRDLDPGINGFEIGSGNLVSKFPA